MLNPRRLPLPKRPVAVLRPDVAVPAASPQSNPADGDGTDDSFRWANHLALRARIAVSSSLVALASLLHTWPAVRLPLAPLVAVAAFEALINQPYPFLRRLTGSQERVYLLNLTCDIAAFTVAAYALGSLAEHFLFFVFLFSIALVGATAGRRLAYWTASLGGVSSILLASLSNRGLLPVLSPAARHVAGTDSGPVVMVHIFCFFLLAFFVSIPATKLRQDIRRRKRVERELRASEAELTHRAFHDPLTGIPNRALFARHLSHALEVARGQRQTLAVLFLDFDRFKQVNDSLGHTAGDALLVALARRLRSHLRTEDTVARFGGDEFMILLERLERMGDAERVAENLLAAVREPFELEGGHEVATSASIGIALATPIATGLAASDLLRHADIAVHRAKAAGRACAVVFDGTMNHQVLERVALESDLRYAVPRGQLRVFYQPLLQPHTGRITGAEALVRWQHPQRGLLRPAEFIGIAEESGLILPIGEWVLAEACRQLQEWEAHSPRQSPLMVSVNLSARQFQQRDMVEQVARLLRASQVDPKRLELEITESTMMQDVEGAAQALQALKRLGVRLAIDDFGTGYSSLSYVRHFSVDTLKVDQSFVRDLGRDRVAAAIVEAVTSLAHAVGSSVTAEGIETAEQLQVVRSLACDLGQGNYFSRPLPASQFGDLLAASSPRAQAIQREAAPLLLDAASSRFRSV